MKDALIELFERDILRLKDEINSYQHEENIWLVAPGISNSAGNLCLHLVGNLNHFIGAVLGNSGYVRERDKEFADKHVPVVKLVSMVEATRDIVVSTLKSMSEDSFTKDFPEIKHDKILKTDFMLMHLLAHLSYHLGQVNYHRRLLENK